MKLYPLCFVFAFYVVRCFLLLTALAVFSALRHQILVSPIRLSFVASLSVL